MHLPATLVLSSGITTPRHTRACAHVKFAGAQVKILWKAKVKDQVLACASASFMWTASIQVRRHACTVKTKFSLIVWLLQLCDCPSYANSKNLVLVKHFVGG